MRVLLTGAGGFIGSHVAVALADRGHEVVGVARRAHEGLPPSAAGRVHMEVADLADRHEIDRLIRAVQPEALLHAAWYVEPGRYLHATAENLESVEMTLRLFRLALDAGCGRLVSVGTGFEPPGVGWPGGVAPPIATTYSLSKAAVHAAAAGLAAEGVSATCAHVFYLYGPGEQQGRLVPALIGAALRGEPIDVTDGRQRRNYLHVADVASGLATVVDHDPGPSIDVCSPAPIEVRELYDAVGDATGRRRLIRDGARPYGKGEVLRATGDPGPLQSLGWEPEMPLADGIADTVSWWRNQLERRQPNLAS